MKSLSIFNTQFDIYANGTCTIFSLITILGLFSLLSLYGLHRFVNKLLHNVICVCFVKMIHVHCNIPVGCKRLSCIIYIIWHKLLSLNLGRFHRNHKHLMLHNTAQYSSFKNIILLLLLYFCQKSIIIIIILHYFLLYCISFYLLFCIYSYWLTLHPKQTYILNLSLLTYIIYTILNYTNEQE